MAIIGVDLDNTIYPRLESIAQFIHIKYGVPLENMPTDVSGTDPFLYWDVPEDALRTYIKAAHLDGSIYDSSSPIDGAAEMIRKLKEQGNEIWILCDRDYETTERTEEWLKEHRIPYDRLAMLAHNRAIYPIDTLIDDDPKQLRITQPMGTNPVLFARPWNLEAATRYPSFKDWKAISGQAGAILGLYGDGDHLKMAAVKLKPKGHGVGTNQYAIKAKSSREQPKAKRSPKKPPPAPNPSAPK